jgi:pyruvate formate lyase activating enzyme
LSLLEEVREAQAIVGQVFDLDTFAIHDGPGIRLTVYLKGCPLSCAWCHSPESQSPERQLVIVRDRCAYCGACADACPQGGHHVAEGVHTINRTVCRACGQCVDACPQGALSIKGYTITAGEVIERAIRMKSFFHYSGGGVTLTGGEVTLQADFAEAVLRGCRAEGIHTAMETSGACTWATLERLLAHTDLLLYDIKLIDDAAHRRWVSASNRAILENARRLAGYNVQVRVPLIPDITDTEENLRAIYAFMVEVGLRRVAILPYNEATAAKYEWLDLPFAVPGARQSPEQLAHLLSLGEQVGLEVSLG